MGALCALWPRERCRRRAEGGFSPPRAPPPHRKRAGGATGGSWLAAQHGVQPSGVRTPASWGPLGSSHHARNTGPMRAPSNATTGRGRANRLLAAACAAEPGDHGLSFGALPPERACSNCDDHHASDKACGTGRGPIFCGHVEDGEHGWQASAGRAFQPAVSDVFPPWVRNQVS